jgi:hypothetical protein
MHYRLMLFFAATIAIIKAKAQDFSGYRTGNYTGVNGVFFNPASIAGNGYRYDVNVFGISAAVANKRASFGLSDLGKSINGDSVLNRIFAGNDTRTDAAVSVAALGPSFMLALDKKSAIAFTTRARAMMNASDIDSRLARQLISDVNKNNITFPYTIASNQNMNVNANGWTEFGLSYARTVVSNGKHILKGGITLKYLAGAANAYVNVNNLNTTINTVTFLSQPYATNTSGTVGIGFGGINVSNFKAKDLLAFRSAGFGGDIGFQYELRSNDEPVVNDAASVNNYKLKLGVSLLDVGSISYKRDQSRSGTYAIGIPASQRFFLSALSNTSLDKLKDTLRRYPQYFTENTTANTASYSVNLPATLQLVADYHIQNAFFVNAAVQLALAGSGNVTNSNYYNAVSITPRYEKKSFGIYIPVSYNALAKFTSGLALRYGPVFIGSGSLFSALINSSKQVDAQVGVRFGSMWK